MHATAKLSTALLTAAVLSLACRGDSAPTKVAEAVAESDTEVAAKGEAVAQDGAPRIAADEAVYAFGAIGISDTVEHVFKIRNAGDADLKIERVQKT